MVGIRINLKIVVLSILVTILLYPKVFENLTEAGKNIFIIRKLSTAALPEVSTKAGSGKTPVVFVFDDGWESVYTEAYDVMNAYGYRGSISIIPSLTGKKGYMSYRQLSELYLQGWDLLNHSYSHIEMMYDSPDALLLDFTRSRQWMENRYLGKYSDMLIMPYGDINPHLIGQFKDAGYRNVRTSDNIILLDGYKTEYYPVSVINLLTDITVEEVAGLLEQRPEGNKPVIFILHKIGDRDEGLGMTYSRDRFEQIIQLINKLCGQFEVITYSALF